MLTPIPPIAWDDPEWQALFEKLNRSLTLTGLVLCAWQIGLWFAHQLVEQQLHQRGQQPIAWHHCHVCGQKLHSKGWGSRQMLTLVGKVEWSRRIGRCPNRCPQSHLVPFDKELGIDAYQQTSVELMRLGCLLTVFVPFELAVWLLEQMTGIRVSNDTLWNWTQRFGAQAMTRLEFQLQQLAEGHEPLPEVMDDSLSALPLAIAADGVSVPFRAQVGSPKGKIHFQEIKIAVIARLEKTVNRAGKTVNRLRQRRLVAVLGDIEALQPRLQWEALHQGLTTAVQVVWISDGARGFWRLFQESLSDIAVGILDFYHAAGQLSEAVVAYGKTMPNRTPQQWFNRLRYQLRQGYVHRIIKEFEQLLQSPSTPPSAHPTLKRVKQYLKNHRQHLQYRQFKQAGLPIGSGMVESACNWLITQRFKGTGMRWSEPGFNHLLHLRLAWVNQRFDSLFSDQSLAPKLYSPNR
jgi:hypothetical protein